jgi:Tfp pilus assembly protein PilO
MSRTSQIVVVMLATVAIAFGFWTLVLSPKREEASKLRGEIDEAKTSLAQHQQEVDLAQAAKKRFAANYRETVVLGKAVPRDDETASLLVQLKAIADHAGVRFQEIELSGEGEGEAAPAPSASVNPEEPAPPTEVAASLLPLGATVGPGGLAVMPYTLKFTGDFSRISSFIKGLDSFVKSTNEGVDVSGRLITINSFTLGPMSGGSFPQLEGTFSITTFITPPGESASGEVPSAASSLETATPAAEVTGAAP